MESRSGIMTGNSGIWGKIEECGTRSQPFAKTLGYGMAFGPDADLKTQKK
jgi:hypothetical protein